MMSSNGKNNLRLLALSFQAIDGIINGEQPKVIRNKVLRSDNTPFILVTHAMLEEARRARKDVYINYDKRTKNRAKRKVRK